jgi:hypothetical protein
MRAQIALNRSRFEALGTTHHAEGYFHWAITSGLRFAEILGLLFAA